MKSTFEVEEKTWSKYAAKVAEQFGTRKLGDIIVILIRAYSEGLIDINRLKQELDN